MYLYHVPRGACKIREAICKCTVIAGSLANVRLVPLMSRLTEDMPGHKDYFYVLSVGPPFEYVIPGFDLLAVDLREMRVQGYDDEG